MSQKSGNNLDLGPAGPLVWFLLGYLATRILDSIKPKRQHVIGGLVIGSGQAGVALSSTLLYVWVLYIIPTDVEIALHSPLLSGLYLLAGASLWGGGVHACRHVLLPCNRIRNLTVSPQSRYADAVRKYIFRKRKDVLETSYGL